MDYKLKRQLVFGTVFIALVALLSAAGYQTFQTEASCTDGIQNQNEEGVDCGGMCLACRVTRLRKPDVLLYRAFPSGSAYDVLAQMRNPNSEHGTRQLSYTFRFFDAAQNQIAEKSGSTYLLAGQTRYVIESGVSVPATPAYITFMVNDPIRWEKQERLTSQVTLPVFSEKYERIAPPETGFARVSGVAENKTEFSLANLDVHVVLVDKTRMPIAAGKTRIDMIRFGESRSFVVLFPYEIVDPADVYSEIMTNVLDATNVR